MMKKVLLFLFLLAAGTACGENVDKRQRPPRPVIVSTQFSFVFVDDPVWWYLDDAKLTFVVDVENAKTLAFASWYADGYGISGIRYIGRDLGEVTTGRVTVELADEGDVFLYWCVIAISADGVCSESSDTVSVNDLIDDERVLALVDELSATLSVRDSRDGLAVSVVGGMLQVAGIQPASLALYNTEGVLVRKETHSSTLPVSSLGSGVYILKAVSNDNKHYTKKIKL